MIMWIMLSLNLVMVENCNSFLICFKKIYKNFYSENFRWSNCTHASVVFQQFWLIFTIWMFVFCYSHDGLKYVIVHKYLIILQFLKHGSQEMLSTLIFLFYFRINILGSRYGEGDGILFLYTGAPNSKLTPLYFEK